MSLLVLAAAWGLLALPAIAQPWLRRLPPTQTVAVATASLILGLASLVVGLVAIAAPTVLRAAGFAELAGMCQRSLGSLAPGGSAVGWAAVILTAAVTLGAISSARRTRLTRRRARVEPWLGDHHDRGTFELVIVPAGEPLAYSIPGAPPQVVVSSGLVRRLTLRELAAVVRHERAHLEGGHHWYLTLACVTGRAAGFLPGVLASADALRLALERGADEQAAGSTTVRRRALRGALLATAESMVARDLAALGGAGVLERAAALDRPPRASSRPRLAVLVACVGVLGIGGVWAVGDWTRDAGALLAMGRYCMS